MAQMTPNQVLSACYAAMTEETAEAAAKRVGHILLAEMRDREVNFSRSSERKATEAEEAMAELEEHEPADDDANLFTKGAA